MKTRGSLRVVLLGDVHGDQPQRLADLDGGQPDAGGLVHGLEHVVDQRAQRLIDGFDRFGHQPQLFFGNDENVTDCHGRDLRAVCGRVNVRFCRPLQALERPGRRLPVRSSFATRPESG